MDHFGPNRYWSKSAIKQFGVFDQKFQKLLDSKPRCPTLYGPETLCNDSYGPSQLCQATFVTVKCETIATYEDEIKMSQYALWIRPITLVSAEIANRHI